MDQIGGLLDLLLHPRNLIEPFGPLAYLIIFAVLFAETGLFAGFFLPGDSLLLVAGVLSAKGTGDYTLNLGLVIVACVAGAFLGNLVGFWFGRTVGRPLFERPDSRFFKRSHLEAADAFYNRVRRHHHHRRPIHAVHPHVRPDRGRREPHGPRQVRALLGHRRRALGRRAADRRLPAR